MWNSEVVLKAICWTFVHSLWQGVLVAIIAGLLIVVTKKTKAVFRYNLLLLLFVFFLLVVAVTFAMELSHDRSAKENSNSTILRSTPNLFLLPFSKTISYNYQPHENFIGTLFTFFDEHASTIVLLWFVFFIAHGLKLSFGVSHIRRLQKSAVAPSGEWRSLAKQLSERLGLRQSVILMESSLVNVPLTFGFFKATILIPLGLLSNLPPDQVEAVLLHELAHIRRKDYLVNLMQNLVEIIFFFNPAILWISSLIRQEREACCDDIVLAHMPQKQVYLEALVSFQEYSFARSGSALALTHKRNFLLQRIKRMLTKENQKLNTMEKTLLVLALMAITAFGFISKAQDPTVPSPPAAQPAPKPIESQPSKPAQPATTFDLPRVAKKPKQPAPAAIIKNDTVPSVQKKSSLQKENFSSVTTKSHDNGETKTYELEATDNEGKTYRVKKVNDVMTEFMVDGKTVEPGTEAYKERLDQLERLEREGSQKARAEAQKKVHEKMKERHQKEREKFAKQQEEQKIQYKIQREGQEKNRVEMKRMQEERITAHKAMALHKQENLKNKIKTAGPRKQYIGNNGEINSIIYDLTKNNVITSADALSFSLNNKELIVNGKKQPANLHQSLKEKYLQKPGDHIRYSKKGGSTSININKE